MLDFKIHKKIQNKILYLIDNSAFIYFFVKIAKSILKFIFYLKSLLFLRTFLLALEFKNLKSVRQITKYV